MAYKLKGPNTLGILCVLTAVMCFSASDMLIKWLGGSYPLHEIIFVRACVALTIIAGIFVPLEGGYRNLRTKRMPLHVLRGCSVIVANMMFFTGVASLPIADATAIFFVAPLFITALSVPFLGERVGLRRWAAVSIGLIGVIIIIRPGTDAFKWAALAPILAALAYATMQITARRLGVTEKASVMAFYIQLTFLSFCTLAGLTIGDGRLAEGLDDPSLLALLRAWQMPSTNDLLVMLVVGALSACGAYLISQGYRSVEATIAAPFEYIAMPMAVMWGVVMFDEFPDAIAIGGILLIVASGLYSFWRENIRGTPIASQAPVLRNR
ncbi:MAG: DMT family transporter [Alphaproteobacteria bacterium]|nr:DMT family transporter [Alphaproteobacteria bacterium]